MSHRPRNQPPSLGISKCPTDIRSLDEIANGGRPTVRESLESVIANTGSCIAMAKGHERRYTIAKPPFQAVASGGPMAGRTDKEVFPKAAQSKSAPHSGPAVYARRCPSHLPEP